MAIREVTTHIRLSISLAALLLPLYVVMSLNKGIDFTDSGYYYNSIYYLSEITMQTTQFGAVWNLLPIPDSILMHRIAVWTILCSSAIFLYFETWNLAPQKKPSTKSDMFFIVALAMGSVCTYYYVWLPEPSYNSLGFTLNMLIVGLTFRVARKLRETEAVRVETVIAGFLIFGLALARPPTALVLGLCLPLFVVIFCRPNFRQIINLGFWALLGFCIYVLLFSLLVEPITFTYDRIKGGLERREILDRKGLSKSFAQLTKLIAETPKLGFVFAALACLSLAVPFNSNKPKGLLHFGLSPLFFGVIGWWGLVALFYMRTDGFVTKSLFYQGVFMLLIFSAVFLATLLRPFLVREPNKRSNAVTLSTICGILLLALVSQISGTTNSWLPLMLLFNFFICLSIHVSLSSGDGVLNLRTAVLFFPTFFGFQYHAYKQMNLHPYRLAAPLSAQTEKTFVRDGRSILLTDQQTHLLLTHLGQATKFMGPIEERPVLLDMSGVHPLVVYHLGAKPAHSPWSLNSYNGSQRFFDHVIAKLDSDALHKAWILDAPNWQRRFTPQAIEARGKDLATDYLLVAKSYSPLLKQEIVLLAPKEGKVKE